MTAVNNNAVSMIVEQRRPGPGSTFAGTDSNLFFIERPVKRVSIGTLGTIKGFSLLNPKGFPNRSGRSVDSTKPVDEDDEEEERHNADDVDKCEDGHEDDEEEADCIDGPDNDAMDCSDGACDNESDDDDTECDGTETEVGTIGGFHIQLIFLPQGDPSIELSMRPKLSAPPRKTANGNNFRICASGFEVVAEHATNVGADP